MADNFDHANKDESEQAYETFYGVDNKHNLAGKDESAQAYTAFYGWLTILIMQTKNTVHKHTLPSMRWPIILITQTKIRAHKHTPPSVADRIDHVVEEYSAKSIQCLLHWPQDKSRHDSDHKDSSEAHEHKMLHTAKNEKKGNCQFVRKHVHQRETYKHEILAASTEMKALDKSHRMTKYTKIGEAHEHGMLCACSPECIHVGR